MVVAFLYIIRVLLKIIPHTLGILFIFTILFTKFGITPAYAGNTLRTQGLYCSYVDHPRLRGEHNIIIDISFSN